MIIILTGFLYVHTRATRVVIVMKSFKYNAVIHERMYDVHIVHIYYIIHYH